MNKPTSACCGAEIERKDNTMHHEDGPGKKIGELEICTKCMAVVGLHGLTSQPPASKGEGWRDQLGDYCVGYRNDESEHVPKGNYIAFEFDDLTDFIQTAIDEAVKTTLDEILMRGQGGGNWRRIIEGLRNPRSPQ